ncbi:MAG: FtsW/RodA/SpoVE family cell cycle protein, partial [Prevotella sp.]|nr:FtsW/RodA/SpoVE family cell cycle protein [Candidatus Prevotella equi]
MAINESISKLKLLKNIFKGDKVIWTVFFVLCMVSIIEVYSSSSALGYKSGNYWFAALFHTGTLVFGMLLMVAISTVPCRYFRFFMPVCVLGSVLSLLWMLFFGKQVNGAARWIDLGLFQLQPSELAKGTMVLV